MPNGLPSDTFVYAHRERLIPKKEEIVLYHLVELCGHARLDLCSGESRRMDLVARTMSSNLNTLDDNVAWKTSCLKQPKHVCWRSVPKPLMQIFEHNVMFSIACHHKSLREVSKCRPALFVCDAFRRDLDEWCM